MRTFCAILLACLAMTAFLTDADAGPLGLFGRGKGSGSCSSGSCGGSAASSGMMTSSGSWGSSHSMPAPAETGEIASLNRPLDFYVNVQRARVGLPPVVVIASLNAEAKAALKELAAKGELHQTDLPFKHNVARGFKTSAGVVTAWMKGQGQAANILAADYGNCGYATVTGPDGQRYDLLVMAK